MEVGSKSVAVILTDVCRLLRQAFDDPCVGTSPLNSTFFQHLVEVDSNSSAVIPTAVCCIKHQEWL
jgi:hypothetical protein